MAAILSISARNGADSLAARHPIGVSTGVFDELRGVWPRLVAAGCEVSTYAVELSALSEDELPGLIEYLAAKPRLSFRYVSVHAPVKHRVLDDAVSARLLGELPLWVSSIVTHPDALKDRAAYRGLGTRLVLENMVTARAAGGPRTSWRSSSSSCRTPASASTSRMRARSIPRWASPATCWSGFARDCARSM